MPGGIAGQQAQVQRVRANSHHDAEVFLTVTATGHGKGQVLDGETVIGLVGAGHPALQLGVVSVIQIRSGHAFCSVEKCFSSPSQTAS